MAMCSVLGLVTVTVLKENMTNLEVPPLLWGRAYGVFGRAEHRVLLVEEL